MAADERPAEMSKALLEFLAAEDYGDDDAAGVANDDNDEGFELGEVDISTGGGASLAGLEQQLDRLSDHPVLRAILDQVCREWGARASRVGNFPHGQSGPHNVMRELHYSPLRGIGTATG